MASGFTNIPQYAGLLDLDGKYLEYVPEGGSNSEGKFDHTETAPTGTKRLNYSGYFYSTKVFNAIWNDYAEAFNVVDAVEPGDVIMIDTTGVNQYVKSNGIANGLVVGVYSDDYAQLIGEVEGSTNIPIGLAGKVRVKVIGDVAIGDYLVQSELPGVAMSIRNLLNSDIELPIGCIIGQAVEPHEDGAEISRIKAVICKL